MELVYPTLLTFASVAALVLALIHGMFDFVFVCSEVICLSVKYV